MARIPVEKRDAGFPWWGWILALLIAVGAIWLIAELLDNDAEIEPVETAAVYEADSDEFGEPTEIGAEMPTGETITSFTLVAQPVDAQTLAGKKVDFQNMKVTSVVGDKAFYVEPADASNDEDILVVLDEESTPSTRTEGRYDVTAGQQLAVQGSIQRMPPNMIKQLQMVTGQEMNKAQDDMLYIRAQSLNIRS